MSTKNLVCDNIEFAPVNYISSIADQEVTFESGKSFESIIIRSGIFREEMKPSDAGLYVLQTLDFNCISENSVIDMLKLPGIFRLTFSSSGTKIFGALDNPVRFKSIIAAGKTKKLIHQLKITDFLGV